MVGGEPAKRLLRAIDINTGNVAWEVDQKIPNAELQRRAFDGGWRGVLQRIGRRVLGGGREESGAISGTFKPRVSQVGADDLHGERTAIRRRDFGRRTFFRLRCRTRTSRSGSQDCPSRPEFAVD